MRAYCTKYVAKMQRIFYVAEINPVLLRTIMLARSLQYITGGAAERR